ncbi:MAG: hypothetical protein JJ896_12260 [Rhodothermales bacterium]|nr:hypothetical protein [Rhodothermales bacterium]MBO6780418.1 hypothetical protein [Rhodothermales bacterium]
MRTVNVSAKATAELISRTLSDAYPGTLFAVNIAEPQGRRDIHGIDVVWIDGPKREQVEEMLDRFQGVSWDPRTGNLDSRSHMQVGRDGLLEEVFYDIDYIFCDGPTTVLYR